MKARGCLFDDLKEKEDDRYSVNNPFVFGIITNYISTSVAGVLWDDGKKTYIRTSDLIDVESNTNFPASQTGNTNDDISSFSLKTTNEHIASKQENDIENETTFQTSSVTDAILPSQLARNNEAEIFKQQNVASVDFSVSEATSASGNDATLPSPLMISTNEGTTLCEKYEYMNTDGIYIGVVEISKDSKPGLIVHGKALLQDEVKVKVIQRYENLLKKKT